MLATLGALRVLGMQAFQGLLEVVRCWFEVGVHGWEASTSASC